MSIAAVSLKMYFEHIRTLEYCRRVRQLVEGEESLADAGVRLAVLPDFLSIPAVAGVLAGSGIWWGAQDLAMADRGAYTGEVSGADLRGLGCRVVEVGHAERRTLFAEDDDTVAAKVAAAARNDMIPLLCVGEAERETPQAAARRCLDQIRDGIRQTEVDELWVGYEPYWAIGARRPAPADYVREVCGRLRAGLADLPGRFAILYGGSAGPGLLTELGTQVDGLFLGRFAHDPHAFVNVAREAAALTGVPLSNGEPAMSSLNLILGPVAIPRFARVAQHLPARTLDDIEGRLREQLDTDAYRGLVQPGQRIGITAGSRGIANMPRILRGIADWVKQREATPVILPAMGSHGGATAEGQRDMLLHLGITPEATGAEIVASMDVTSLGVTEGGLIAYYSTDALALDGVVLCNRVKAHTDIEGKVESGLLKMVAVGLGKHLGALEVHSAGLADVGRHVEQIAPVLLNKGNIVFGVAVLENAHDTTMDVVAMPTSTILTEEPRLLALSKENLPKILITDFDVLIVDRIGKNISGDGMDPNVIGRSVVGVKNPAMTIGQIVALDMTQETAGNAVGIGLADVTTRRLFDAIDYEPMFTNGVTSNGIAGVRIPPFLANQRMAIQLGERLTLAKDPLTLRIVRIPDTLKLEEISVSEALLGEVAAHPDLELLSDPADLVFDDQGDLFPASRP